MQKNNIIIVVISPPISHIIPDTIKPKKFRNIKKTQYATQPSNLKLFIIKKPFYLPLKIRSIMVP